MFRIRGCIMRNTLTTRCPSYQLFKVLNIFPGVESIFVTLLPSKVMFLPNYLSTKY